MLTRSISRREYLKTSALITGAAVSSAFLVGCSENFVYLHGVASGDPLSDRVIIWTRVTPRNSSAIQAQGTWQVALDEKFENIVRWGVLNTNNERDFTVKIDVPSLAPNTQYFYRFVIDGAVSPTGRTRTLPIGHVEQVKFAVVSCANYPQGYFNVYREISKRDVDYVLHLGDYIYEYGPGEYDDQDEVAKLREFNPPHEIIALEDYRLRYAQYRGDYNLQRLHALRPFICIWDDHEVANDAFRDGAENHNEGEGDYVERRNAALKAYYEWLPVREAQDPLHLYRQFEFGDLLNLFMLETRLNARDPQLSHLKYVDGFASYDYQAAEAEIRDENRTLLGETQMTWLKDGLAASSSQWQVLGQQILMARMEVPWRLAAAIETGIDVVTGESPDEILDPSSTANDPANTGPRKVGYNLDAWDGYYAERERLFNTIEELDINVITLAGDTHNAWASNLSNEAGEPIGVEFATASVSSPGISEYIGNFPLLNELFVSIADDLQYANVYDRGFLMLDVQHEQAQAEWVFVNTVKHPLYRVKGFAGKKLSVYPGAENRRIVRPSE